MTDSKFLKQAKATVAGVILATSSAAMANEPAPPVSDVQLKERVELIAKSATAEVNKVDCDALGLHETHLALERRVVGTAITTGIGAFFGGFVGAGAGAVVGTGASWYTWNAEAKEIKAVVALCETDKRERLQRIDLAKSLSVFKR